MKTSEKIKRRIANLNAYVAEADADGFDEYIAGKMWAKEDEVEFLQQILKDIEAAEQKAVYASWNDEILRDYQEREFQEQWK